MPDDPLLEEYKILLAKIDKIGDYRFTVRGWSATIVLGLLLGSSAINVPSYIVLLALPVVSLFYLMEMHQNNLQIVLMKRAASLERILQKASTKHYVDPNPYAGPIGPVPGIATALNRSGRRATGLQRVAQRSDFAFYLMQVILILIAFGVNLSVGRKKDSPQNVYFIDNATDTLQPSGQPNDERKEQHPKGDSRERPKRERKAGMAKERDRSR